MKFDNKLFFNREFFYNKSEVLRLCRNDSSFDNNLLKDLHSIQNISTKERDYFMIDNSEANYMKDKLTEAFKDMGYIFLKKGVFFDYYEYNNQKFVKMKFTFPPQYASDKNITLELLEKIVKNLENIYSINFIDSIEYMKSRFNFILLWRELK